MVFSYFSWKTMNYIKTLSFPLTRSNWHSNACHIYLPVVILGWLFNTFEIILFQKIFWMDFRKCFNFFFMLHKVTFHIKLHTIHLLAMIRPSSGICFIIVGEVLHRFTSWALCLQLHDAFATNFPYTNSKWQPKVDTKQ
jgi:hypothetical protein